MKPQNLLSLLLIAITSSLLNYLNTYEPDMYPQLNQTIQEVKSQVSNIPEDRKEELDALAQFIQAKVENGEKARLTFICTHNSRRSHMSQIWAATAAADYGMADHVETYSGGTEATAFNPRAVKAMKEMGFKIDSTGEENPVYSVTYAEKGPVMKCWSKVFEDPANPSKGFAAVMTCSHADEACPIVPGAEARFSIPYEDPKAADNTPEEAQRYLERSEQIATEMFYVFSKIN
jgi:arsenate reductase